MTEPLSRSISQSPPRGEAAYRRGDPFDKRRNLMEAWARFCSQATSAGEVISIRSA
jgi:hypothetical protein